MGRRAWLDELLQNRYLPTIAAVDDSLEGREQLQQLVVAMRDEWAQRGKKDLKQQQSLMDLTRRAIKDKFGEEHFSLDVIGFSRQESFELNRLKQGNARERQIHQQYLKDPDAIVATAVRLLDSPEWAELAAGLAVLTGRRLNEVLKTAEFTVKSQWVVSFRGALKRQGESVPLVFDIPTLTTAKRVVEATDRLRAITPTTANESKVAITSDRAFNHLVPAPHGKDNLYAHLWRSVYCCIATFWYCPKHVDDLLFKAHIMGHFETLTEQERGNDRSLRQRLETFNSERHYRLYEIDDELITYYQGKRKGVKLGVAGIEPLEVFAHGLPQHQSEPSQRKHPSSLRVWREDHDSLAAILNYFEGKTQPDRVSAWITWTTQQLQKGEDQQTSQPEQNLQSDTGETETSAEVSQEYSTTNRVNEQAIAPTTTSTPSQTEEREETPAHPIQFDNNPIAPVKPSGLETKIDKLIDVMTLFVQSQLQSNQTKTKERAIDLHTTPETQTHAIEQQTSEQGQPQAARPRKYKTGEADSIINRAIDAIIAHNDLPGRLHDDKWAITINGLKNFSPNQRAIERIISERKDEIDQHHTQHQLSARHNDRHKRKFKVNQVISL